MDIKYCLSTYLLISLWSFTIMKKAQKVTHQVINRVMKESRKEGKLIVMQKQINSYEESCGLMANVLNMAEPGHT